MRPKQIKIFFVIGVLLLAVYTFAPVYAHEEGGHLEHWVWNWSDQVEKGDSFNWDYSKLVDGVRSEGKLELEVTEEIKDINIVEEINQNPSYLSGPDQFLLTGDAILQNSISVIVPPELLTPISFDFGNGTTANFFNDRMYEEFGNSLVPMIQDSLRVYVDLVDINYDLDDDELFISGNMISSYSAPGNVPANGTFEVKYNTNTGLLDYYNWENNDGRNAETLERDKSIFEVISVNTFWAITPIIALAIILPSRLKKNN